MTSAPIQTSPSPPTSTSPPFPPTPTSPRAAALRTSSASPRPSRSRSATTASASPAPPPPDAFRPITKAPPLRFSPTTAHLRSSPHAPNILRRQSAKDGPENLPTLTGNSISGVMFVCSSRFAGRMAGSMGRKGFTLIEASLATVIISVGVMAMMQLFTTCTQENQNAAQTSTAIMLAGNIQEIARGMAFNDPASGRAIFGPEDDEIGDLAMYDDVDDL